MKTSSNGAIAVNKKRTSEEKKELSKKMVSAKKHLASLPKCEYSGELQIADMTIYCCVLSDGQRLISETAVQGQFGSSGGKLRSIKKQMEEEVGAPIPLFIASKALIPLIEKVFSDRNLEPIEYNNKGRVAFGYKAEILPKVWEIWLLARDQGLLQSSQLIKAKKAELIVRGLAKVGITALIDEATGYQRDRERDALAKILEAFVAKELQPYVKTFDAEFYEQMFRLKGLPYPPEENIHYRPQYFGTLTNNIVYDRLAPGVKDALKAEAKKVAKKHKLFQHLTADKGRQELIKHLGTVTGLMKISNNWDEFIGFLDRVKPKFGQKPLGI